MDHSLKGSVFIRGGYVTNIYFRLQGVEAWSFMITQSAPLRDSRKNHVMVARRFIFEVARMRPGPASFFGMERMYGWRAFGSKIHTEWLLLSMIYARVRMGHGGAQRYAKWLCMQRSTSILCSPSGFPAWVAAGCNESKLWRPSSACIAISQTGSDLVVACALSAAQ